MENAEERKARLGGRKKTPIEVVRELQTAMNQHDLDAMITCFDPDYESEFPAHPDRAFRGHGQMRKNWSQIFASVPDIEAAVLRCASDGDTVWAEWEWKGTRIDGSTHLIRGVTVQGVQEDRIKWVRLYMEPVIADGGSDFGVRQNLGQRS